MPSAGQVQAAQNKVNQSAAALGKQEEKLAAANAQLTDLEAQAEILTENYDKTVVAEQQAESAYATAVKDLAQAEGAQKSSQRQVANLAAMEFETQGGFDPIAAMLGDAQRRAGLPEPGRPGTGIHHPRDRHPANNSADSVVAGVFRSEARTALRQKQADLRQAAALRTAIQAAVARQLAAVKSMKSVTSQLSGLLQNAKTHRAVTRIEAPAPPSPRSGAAAAAAAAAAQQGAGPAGASRPGPAVLRPEFPGQLPAGQHRSRLGAQPDRPALTQWGGAGLMPTTAG